MTTAKILHAEIECKSSADKFWPSLRDLVYVYPKAFPPGTYKSIEVLEGDGVQPGSVRVRTYGEGSPIAMFKEKIEVVDEQNKIFGFSIMDGDLIKGYKSLKCSAQVVPKDEASLLKFSCEYEKAADEDIVEPTVIVDFAVKLLKQIDDYSVMQA
ncbi:MLP-like protein 423 [Humulus lupulus]|uniref:MLP-like protein 423 n=1 Tax=Humulus lupulus TaxID=3486 RepID=UPI002B416E43|nr:MLP-like protein 423 [Humulus lupulus]